MAAGPAPQQYPMGYAGLVTPQQQGAIPDPAAPPPAPEAAAPEPQPQGKPRPEGPTGFYKPPDEATLGGLIKQGLDWIQDRVTGKHTPPGAGAVPGPQEQGGPEVAQRALGSNTMAATPEEMRQAYKASDPEGKLSPQELQLKTMQDMADYWMAHGRPDRAQSAVAAVMLYGKKVASTMGYTALAAIQAGNLERAAQYLQKGYSYIPDGKSVRFEPTPDGKIDYWFIDGNGQPLTEKVSAGPSELKDLAVAMANGSGWMQSMFGTQRGGRGAGVGGAGGAAGAKTAAQAHALEQVNAAADALMAARESGDEAAIKKAEDDFRTTATSAMAVPGNGPAVTRIASLTMPDVFGPKRGTPKKTYEQQLDEQSVEAEKQFDTQYQTETDPERKKRLAAQRPYVRADIAYGLQKPDDQIDENRLDKLLGDDAPDANPEDKVDVAKRATLRTAAAGILRMNKASPNTVVDALKALLDRKFRLSVDKSGRVKFGGFGSFFVTRNILGTLAPFEKKEGEAPAEAEPAP